MSVDRNPQMPPVPGKLSSAKKANEAAREQVLARRAHVHQQHREEMAAREADAESASQVQEASPPPQREDIETIEFDAPNGLHIEYGPPRNVSLWDRIARMYAGRDASVSEFRLTRLLMGIRSIDGKPVRPIANEIDRTSLANRIGDETLDLLMAFDRQHFPPLTQAEIPQIQKNLRQS